MINKKEEIVICYMNQNMPIGYKHNFTTRQLDDEIYKAISFLGFSNSERPCDDDAMANNVQNRLIGERSKTFFGYSRYQGE